MIKFLLKYNIVLLVAGIIFSGAVLYGEIYENTENAEIVENIYSDLFDDSASFDSNSRDNSFDDFDDFGSMADEKATFNIKVYTEYRGLISTYSKQDFSDIYKKHEFKTNINFKYGFSHFYLQSDSNVFLLPGFISQNLSKEYKYSSDFYIKRNGTITSEYAEIDFRELYLNYDKSIWRFRAGNQIHHWGTADAIKLTSYFNPFDMRELLFKNEDTELTMGVPSISALAFIGSDSLEIVFVPIHTPSRAPVTGTYWGLKHREGPFPVVIDEEKGIDSWIKGAGLGIKYYRNIKNFDTHLSLYRGPDKETLFRPVKTVSRPDEPVSIMVEPQYKLVTIAGIALSNTWERFIFQFEGIYSPDKRGVVNTKVDSSKIDDLLPFKIEKSHYFAYSAGFNYFVPFSPSKEGMLTAEWSRSHMLNDKIIKSFLSDIITIRVNEHFFQRKIETSLTAIINRSASLYVVSPLVRYKYNDHLSCEIKYAYTTVQKNNYYSGYKNNDFVEWRVRYEY